MRAAGASLTACSLALGAALSGANVLADDARIVGVRLGYDGVLPPERWSPLWVTIQPGDKPQSLVLSVRYEQDPTQNAVMVTPVTTTPGRTITVPLLVCAPQDVGRIEIELEGGNRVSRTAFARAPRPDEQNLSPSVESGALIVGSLVQRLPAEAISPWKTQKSGMNSGLDRAAIVALRPADIGETWAALDGLNVLVARQTSLDALPAASLDAIAAWVNQGGRLVLIADTPERTWQRFAPSGIHLDDQRRMASPGSLAQLMPKGHSLAGAITARPIVIAGLAATQNWQGRHTAEGGSLIAIGPCGGGMTAVAGFDPTLASAELSDAAAAPVWEKLIRSVLPDRLPAEEDAEDNGYYGYSTSGDGREGATALGVAVDALCDIPSIPTWVYALIVALAAGMALLVSIGDFLLLGRFKSRHRSWITAAAWTAAFGLLAWALPNIVRRDDTTLGRAVVIDHLPGGAWRTGVTALFAASSARAPMTAAPPAAGDLDGCWRGASVLGMYSFRDGESRRSTPDLTMLQRISALDGSAAAVAPPASGIALRQWTLRTLTDQGPARNAPIAAFEPGGQYGAFVVRGLPKGTDIRNAAVHTAAGWATLTAEPATPAKTVRLLAGTPTGGLTFWHNPRLTTDQQRNYRYGLDDTRPSPEGASLLMLDGARRRTAAFDALAEGGNYAVVHLLCEGPIDVSLAIPHHPRGMTVYRIAVPLVDSPPPAATP